MPCGFHIVFPLPIRSFLWAVLERAPASVKSLILALLIQLSLWTVAFLKANYGCPGNSLYQLVLAQTRARLDERADCQGDGT